MDHLTLTTAAGVVVHKMTSMAIGAPIKALLKQLKVEKASETLNKVYQQQVNDIALEWPANLQRLEEQLAADGRDLRAELQGKLDEREATILFFRMFDEAVESATRERLLLMCAGMAGVFSPDLDVETKSRVVRAVAMLEPSDVATLRRLVDYQSGKLRATPFPPLLDPPPAAPETEISGFQPTEVNWQTLRRSGCTSAETNLRVRSGDRPPELEEELYVTEVGRAVLVFLATYQVDEEPLEEPAA